MKKIYVLYDSRCGLCSHARTWMLEQRALIDIEFVAAGSERARRLFPELGHQEVPSELVVVSDNGEAYFGDAAWIVCLYALADYRNWSYRLARPPLRGLARRAWEMISAKRQELSRIMTLESDHELMKVLQAKAADTC